MAAFTSNIPFYGFFRKKHSIERILILIFAFTSVRVAVELVLLDYGNYVFLIGVFENYVRFYLENIFYFLMLFLILVFFISKLSKESFKIVANFGIKIAPLIIAPPIIDFFVFGRRFGYVYGKVGNFIYNVLTFAWVTGDTSHGIALEITLASFLIGGFVYYKRRSIARSLFAVFLTSFIIMLLSTPDIFFGEGGGDFVFDYFLPIYYFFPLILLSSYLYYAENREKLKAIVSNLRHERGIMFAAAVVVGYFSLINTNYELIFSLSAIFRLFLTLVSVFFAWWFSIAVNDIYDYEIDKISNTQRPIVKGILSTDEYKFISVIFAFFALSFAALLSFWVFTASAWWLLLGVAYSRPPIRLRNTLLGNAVIGIALATSFQMGILSIGIPQMLLLKSNLTYSFLLFIIGAIVTLTKDLKDINSDATQGIYNVYTALGRKKGKKVVTFTMLAVLNSPALLIQDLSLLPLTLLLSSVTSYIYYKKEDERLAYLGGAILLIYLFAKLYL